MGEEMLFTIPQLLLERLDVGWNLLLLLARYAAFMILIPGIGGGGGGLTVRYPLVVCLAFVSLDIASPSPLPPDLAMGAAQLVSEVILGSIVAALPLMIVAGAATAGQIASGTMGLNGAQLFDPTTSASLPDLARIYSDLSVIVFLLLGGHHVAIAELAGLDSAIKPGTFMLSGMGLQTLIDQSGRIFQIGCMIASPVIVALLLTNFVMGLISKAVPSVNLFIISFPLTIGIGFFLTMFALPEVVYFLDREFGQLGRLTALVAH